MATFASFPVETGAASHPGKLRTDNEDSFLDHAAAGLWAVADGMGGHASGSLASRTLIEGLGAVSPAGSAARLLAECETRVISANRRLREIAQGQDQIIGTTLAALLVFGQHFACIWCGDSRIYRVRARSIDLLSRDHTEVQSLVDTGVLAESERHTWPRRHVITRAIGVDAAPELEIVQGLLAEGDLFVLCSDGLTTHVEAQEILALTNGRSAQAACDALIDLALDRGGADNVTVLVVRCGPPRP